MNIITFTVGGKLGDFIHSLYVVKNICEQRNAKANLYLTEDGDVWAFGIKKAYHDLFDIVSVQPYINHFALYSSYLNWQISPEIQYINLNRWRQVVATTHAETGKYNKCWSELLSEHYGFEIPKEYKWLEVKEVNEFTKGATVVHRSTHHHSSSSFWLNEFHKIKELAIFVTTDKKEWDSFEFKHYTIPHIVPTVSDWVVAINSCDYFIGNQSAGFAIASALDKERKVELYSDVSVFYVGEAKYSKHINFNL